MLGADIIAAIPSRLTAAVFFQQAFDDPPGKGTVAAAALQCKVDAYRYGCRVSLFP